MSISFRPFLFLVSLGFFRMLNEMYFILVTSPSMRNFLLDEVEVLDTTTRTGL